MRSQEPHPFLFISNNEGGRMPVGLRVKRKPVWGFLAHTLICYNEKISEKKKLCHGSGWT